MRIIGVFGSQVEFFQITLTNTVNMFITDLPGEIIVFIMARLVSLQTLQRFLKAMPSMAPLLANYSSGITKSVSQFLQEEHKLICYMNAISAAHFSDQIHTVDEL